MAGELALIAVSAMFVNNFVLARFLGICPFLGVSRRMESAVGMSMAVLFVMTVASLVTWLIQKLVLVPFGLAYLQTITFILVIASLVQLVEMVVQKTSPVLYQALGIFLPLITTNCAILGVAILVQQKSYGFLATLTFAVSASAGFGLALVLLAGLRESLALARLPRAFQGNAIVLITAGILSLAFMGFSGLVRG
ncbi:MAG: electron transport complex subunit RsxA [Leptospirillia bacterium]